MILKQIELSAFRGVRDKLLVPFGSAFTVITGRNGSGKSTVCDAIEFALTGTLSRFSLDDVESGERISDYIWCRESPSQAVRGVRASFILDDGKEISRAIGPDREISGAKNEDFYDPGSCPPDPIERITQTSIIRDELIAKLSTDMTEADRFDFVHKAIGTTNLTTLERRAIYISEQITKSQRELEREYSTVRDRVADLVAQISEARLLASQISRVDIQSVRARLRSLVGIEVDDTQSIIAAVERRMREVRMRVSDLDRLRLTLLNLDRQQSELNRLNAESEVLRKELAVLGASVNKAAVEFTAATERLTSAQQLSPVDSSLAQLREHGSRVGLRGGRCPLCGSRITDHDFNLHLQELKRELDERSATLGRLVEEQAQASSRHAANKREFETKSVEYSRCQAESQTLSNGLSAAQTSAANLDVPLDVVAIGEAAQRARSLLSELEQGRDILEANLAVGRIADLEQSKSEAEALTNDLAIRISRLSTAGQNAKSAADSVKRVAWEIVDERLASLSPLLSEMYVRLRPHMAYSDVTYRMRGDVKRFLSFAVGKDINPRFIFSSGQRRALGLAFLLSVYLARPWCYLRTLVMDDPVQHIDDYRSLHLVETLAAIRHLGRQVICTVEDPSLAELLCRRLRATSLGEGMLLELEYDPQQGTLIRKKQDFGPLPRTMLVPVPPNNVLRRPDFPPARS